MRAKFTTRELFFFVFRDTFVKATMAAVGAKTENEAWRRVPDLGFRMSVAWWRMTQCNGCVETEDG